MQKMYLIVVLLLVDKSQTIFFPKVLNWISATAKLSLLILFQNQITKSLNFHSVVLPKGKVGFFFKLSKALKTLLKDRVLSGIGLKFKKVFIFSQEDKGMFSPVKLVLSAVVSS